MLSYRNLPDIFYLGVYQPLTGECEGDFDFTEYRSMIWDLKKCQSSVIDDFVECISSNLGDDFDCIVVVPPHDGGKVKSGIKLLAQKIAEQKNRIDATSCMIRHKTIDKISTGGNRSLETHLQSIKVVWEELIKCSTILIFDDVYTTGNSLEACQELLKLAGANTVKSFVLGKTIRHEEELNFFELQYESIEEKIAAQTRDAHRYTDYKFRIKKQELLQDYKAKKQELLDDKDNLFDEDFEDFDSEIEQTCAEAAYEIHWESEREEGAINDDADCQMEALNNLYKFSGIHDA